MSDSTMEQRIQQHFVESARVKSEAAIACVLDTARAAQIVADCFLQNGRLLLCGNGGSAADCQHIAAEFVSALNMHFVRRALGAIALTTDTSFLTANANDFGFEYVFSRQVEALGQQGDVLLGISTSGKSKNVVNAMQVAQVRGLRTIAFTGEAGGPICDHADVSVKAPSNVTQHIQETHITAAHALCDVVEQLMFGQQT